MPSNPLEGVSLTSLDRLAGTLAAGGFDHGLSEVSIRRHAPGIPSEAIKRLASLSEQGWNPEQILQLVEATRTAYRSGLRESHLVDLVLSGPEHAAVPTRDTHAVFRELISEAKTELLVATFAIHNGSEILQPLAKRMDENADLKVSMFLNIHRGHDDRTLPSETVARFRHELVSKHWPGQRLPSLHYFKPSAESDWRQRASMHAKLIVADRRRTFLSSANLTKAAQTRNIEVGTLMESESIANRISDYFTGLTDKGEFAPL